MSKTIAAVTLALSAGLVLGAGSQKPKVARMWHGKVPIARADEYQRYLYESGVVKLRGIARNEGVQMLRRDDGQTAEFVVVSYWPDKEAIHAYAGADIEKVHDLPRDHEFLIEPEKLVRHFEVVVDDR
jgi:heme-degrading monooxygenase HmoA